MKTRVIFIIATLFLTGVGLMPCARVAHAVPIEYSVSIFGASGSLGTRDFNGIVFIKFIGDTANVIQIGPDHFNNIGTATFTVLAIPSLEITATATILDPVSVVEDCGCQRAGIGIGLAARGKSPIFTKCTRSARSSDLAREIVADRVPCGDDWLLDRVVAPTA